MELVELTPGGLRVSPIIWGAMRILDSETTQTPARLAATIDALADMGITTIDTADIYGGYAAEEALGAGLQQAAIDRSQLQIVTKGGIRLPFDAQPDVRFGHYDFTPDYLMQQLDRSLLKLGLDQVDLYLLHRPDCLMDADAVAEFLSSAHHAGKIANAGVSNFTVHQLDLLKEAFPNGLQTNQIEISPAATDVLDTGALEQAQSLSMRPMAWGPLGGVLPNSQNPEQAERLSSALNRVAARYGLDDLSVLALAWVMRLPCKPIPIIGTTRIERAEAALRALTVELATQDWYEILVASRGAPMP